MELNYNQSFYCNVLNKGKLLIKCKFRIMLFHSLWRVFFLAIISTINISTEKKTVPLTSNNPEFC